MASMRGPNMPMTILCISWVFCRGAFASVFVLRHLERQVLF